MDLYLFILAVASTLRYNKVSNSAGLNTKKHNTRKNNTQNRFLVQSVFV